MLKCELTGAPAVCFQMGRAWKAEQEPRLFPLLSSGSLAHEAAVGANTILVSPRWDLALPACKGLVPLPSQMGQQRAREWGSDPAEAPSARAAAIRMGMWA